MSPRHTMRSAPSPEIASKVASSASRLAWMSEMMATFMRRPEHRMVPHATIPSTWLAWQASDAAPHARAASDRPRQGAAWLRSVAPRGAMSRAECPAPWRRARPTKRGTSGRRFGRVKQAVAVDKARHVHAGNCAQMVPKVETGIDLEQTEPAVGGSFEIDLGDAAQIELARNRTSQRYHVLGVGDF